MAPMCRCMAQSMAPSSLRHPRLRRCGYDASRKRSLAGQTNRVPQPRCSEPADDGTISGLSGIRANYCRARGPDPQSRSLVYRLVTRLGQVPSKRAPPRNIHTTPTKATAAVVGVGVSAIDRFLAGDGSALTPGTAADCTCQTSPTRAFPILDDHSRRAAIKSPNLIVSRAPPLPPTDATSARLSLLVASSAETDAHNHRPSVAHSSRRLIKHECFRVNARNRFRRRHYQFYLLASHDIWTAWTPRPCLHFSR